MTASPAAKRAGGWVGSAWFWRLLREELALYPGRLSIIGRITGSATIITLVVMTFKLPSASLATFFTFVLSRESPLATLKSGLTLIAAFMSGAAFALAGVMIGVDYPLTHVLWVVGTLFVIFFVIRVVPNYGAAGAFSFVIASAIPAWDTTGPTDERVNATLWTTLAVAVGILITIGFEYIVQSFHPPDDLLAAIDERLAAVEHVLRDGSAEASIPKKLSEKLTRYVTVGTSRLRMMLARSRFNARYAAQMNALVSLTGRLVDLAANLANLHIEPDASECERMVQAANRIADIRSSLSRRKALPAFELREELAAGIPLLPEIERTIALIGYSFAGDASVASELAPVIPEEPRRRVPWVPDAFTNLDHVSFALRGTLAATAAYVTYNVLDWPGINTALATCIITALSTVGASRQKQILRLAGGAIGGLIALAAQTLIFPGVDSITGFLLVFAGVTAFAAWVSSASPRISYAGLQIALAWDLVNLSDPRFQLSLSIARDRVVGILLGLICMWIFYERLGAEGAAQQMLEIFTANLRILARLAMIASETRDRARAIAEVRSIRDKMSGSLGAVNAEADAVLFETGPDRAAKLNLRDRIREWQPQLRTLLLLLIAVLRDRIEISLSAVPPAIDEAQRRFDYRLWEMLNGIARRLEGRGQTADAEALERALNDFDQAVHEHYRDAPPRAQSILALSKAIVQIARRLNDQISSARLPIMARTPRLPENE